MCLAEEVTIKASVDHHTATAATAATTNHVKRFLRPLPLTRPNHHHHQTVVVDDDDDEPRVRFDEGDDEVNVYPSALSCLLCRDDDDNNDYDDDDDEEEEHQEIDRHSLWYSSRDYKEFRRQAQELSQQCREKGDAGEACTRGLELKMSLQRQDRKHMIVKKIIYAQDEEEATPDELAEISMQHSIYSRKLALAQAHKDYYAAYHPGLTSVLPEMPALLDCHKDVVTKKRSLLGSRTMTGRRVRVRMF